MAAITICSDFGAPQNSLSLFPLFPNLFAMKWWNWMAWSSFFECWILSQFFHSLSPSSRGSLVPLSILSLKWYHLHNWIVDISPGNLDSSLCFIQPGISAYKLNKQGDNIQPSHTPFPIWNQYIVPCPVLTVASCPAYRFLRRQVSWSGIPISIRIFHSLLWSTQRL